MEDKGMNEKELQAFQKAIEVKTVYSDWRIAIQNGDEKTAAALEDKLKRLGE